MKPVLAFVLGAILAATLAVIAVQRSGPGEPAPVTTTSPPFPTQESAHPEPITEPTTEPEARTDERPVPPRQAVPRQESRPGQTRLPTAPAPQRQEQTPAPPQDQSRNEQPAASPSGPPQTTINLPPPPDGSRTAQTKPAPPPRVPKTVTIPAGTLLTVRVDKTLSTKTAQVGESFPATLDQALVVDGAVVAERGARVEGRVAESDPGGRVKGTAILALELVRMSTADGQRVRLQTENFSRQADKSTKKDAAKVGIGAGLGAAIGAIAGGGKGAAIGAAAGGAAGTGAVLGTRGEAAEVTAETRMTFRLKEPITVTEKLN